MTFKRNITLDQESTRDILAEHQKTHLWPEKSWLGHEQGNGRIDILLIGGATIEDLALASGRVPSAVNAHLYHLKREHGLSIVHDGNILRFARDQLEELTPKPKKKETSKAITPDEGQSSLRSKVTAGHSDEPPMTSILEEMRLLQLRASERLAAIHVRIKEIDAERENLIEERKQLLFLANGETPNEESARPSIRQPRGVLKDACLAALDASTDGLTSSEVVTWLEKNRPDIMPKSAPSILSRLATDLEVSRDARGVYRRRKSNR